LQADFENKVIISDTTCLIAFTNVNKLNVLKNSFDSIEVSRKLKKNMRKKVIFCLNGLM
jgi:predicted nucleic acid-binding protein